MIGFVEGFIKSAEERGHGEIDGAVTIVNGGIDEDGSACSVA